MTNKELLKSAQEEAGYVPTGYKGDVDLDVFILVCEKCCSPYSIHDRFNIQHITEGQRHNAPLFTL